jgi:DNA-binding response OmpR family regulator
MENTKKARILVVDDEPDITHVIKHGLEAAGFMVDAFNDPAQALSHFKPDYYNIMIFDIKMPKMTGFQLYRQIRKQDTKTSVCFMTAFDVYKEEFEKMFPSYDVKCFIKKPVRIKDLQAMVQGQLGDKEV